jgi:hypothetical protein
MKIFRFALNTWFTLASILSFLLGWVVLGHAPKPVQPAAAPSISMSVPTLQPLQDLQFQTGDPSSSFPSIQQNIQIPSNSGFTPVFRSGGS